MIVTEEEAKTKRCQEGFGPPLHQPKHPDSVIGKIVGPGEVIVTAPIHCIGSACMAWRWATEGNLIEGWAASATLGYCGKAGAPTATRHVENRE